VFNGHESKECLENLKKVQLALDNNSITSNIGIYFRFDNTNDTNKKFNQLVSDTNYNSQLDSSTIVAGIANNKLPKFMVKNTWYPRSVISLTNSFKTNKTSVYCDAVDLQIFYNDRQPIIGGVDALM
jgi:hypothetical protein